MGRVKDVFFFFFNLAQVYSTGSVYHNWSVCDSLRWVNVAESWMVPMTLHPPEAGRAESGSRSLGPRMSCRREFRGYLSP
ncbi:hypothetical protein BDP55DRAFT_197762 [Colletotrichum godetiae]|uniref:Secreted protein n=1 Tax=Colletotrichum godetiae TaxID=1209918 RepID=A0AAJ0AJV4_9PEZI|nr:uncharacterized protein BDP55DRAFT_197762 [Colletotrichum godetiae]KAK1673727.1 hypothetical protein BDP55DRAFT_197762 [Colletotrichum godetiae]